ncbi:hypothetical protein FE251_09555 [Georgenia wutianyii]|uniref:Uncharacterized protein n=1 Tax=Georgenia wutianyii TaxID=2585135 RepID=A0ABX5VMY8_9MICO|nr:hypothetical protein [Georgenia wutianyii]QDB79590.1 hypothetical protein FE251_09555 [Georgenia wutianyii]
MTVGSESPPVVGPGWVDTKVSPIMGLFPLAVERYLNAAVAVHAPGVTTVTTGARYYALHGLAAHEKASKGLSDAQAQDLMRRIEVVFGLACLVHAHSDQHPEDWNVEAHGADFLRARLNEGPVYLDQAAGVGTGTYAKASWGFWGPYRGSEMTLKVLDTKGLCPGDRYDDAAVRGALSGVLDVAERGQVSADDVAHLGSACLCQTRYGSDGDWLANLFAGDRHGEGVGHILGETMAMFANAIGTARIDDEDDLYRFAMYHPAHLDLPEPDDRQIRRRWRGIVMRAESVTAWRYLWADLCSLLPAQGAMPVHELRQWLADHAPVGTVADFASLLPATRDAAGVPLPAERDPSLDHLPEPIRRIAVILLGARRLDELTGAELLGFQGPPDRPEAVEELSPYWVRAVTRNWANRSLRDFSSYLVDTMLNRSQRVALRKSRYHAKSGRFTIPARVNVRDDLVFRVYGETPRRPGLRWRQLLSMGRQVGLFDRADGVWTLGQRGELLGDGS